MAKAARKADTLIVKGSGGAVWEVDDTPAIRQQIDDGTVTLVRGPKTARKTEPAKPDEKPAEGEADGEGGSEDVASGLEDGDEKPAEGEADQAG